MSAFTRRFRTALLPDGIRIRAFGMRAFMLVGLTLLPAPTPGAVQRPTAPELDRAGWNALGANRLEEAADAFREALQLDARNARLLLGAGL
ncbi:MAG TPA: hypothetical protein VLD67_00335, partial [Vicinamibacterales bacterium]|nr:hypothetical protein [Vicinamibacterales bacterium]